MVLAETPGKKSEKTGPTLRTYPESGKDGEVW